MTVLLLADPADTDLSLQALTLASSLGEPVEALLVGTEDGAASLPVDTAHVARHDALAGFAPDAWAACIVELAGRMSPSAVVAPGSERGNEVMARVAARLDLPLAANCTEVRPGPPLEVTRVRWGGSLLEEARVHSKLPLLTSAPHALPAASPGGSPSVESFEPELSDADLAVRVVEHVPAVVSGISLAEAKVVVSGGRGVGSAEGFGILEELAELLGAAVGCSRVVTSAGWRPHTDQVGQTGTKVSPDLYIACGISGATQHIAGCKGAKKILAINSDAEAPILASADYAVIGDLTEIVPAITAELRKAQAA